MKPGLVSITFRALPPEEIIQLVAEARLKGIEWGGDVHVPPGDLERADKLGRMTRDAGLRVASYGSYYAFADCDPDLPDPEYSGETVLSTAVALGAPAVRLWAGKRSPAETPRELRGRIIARARSLAERAEALGVRLDFEFHEKTLTESPASTRALLEGIAHPSVRTLWQPPLQVSLDERLGGLRQIREWVSNVHCNHFGQNPWPDVCALAEGADEWRAYLALLRETPGERWILIEHVRGHAVEAFQEDAASLRSWLEAEAD